MRPAAQRVEPFFGGVARRPALGALLARAARRVVAWRERRRARLAFEALNAYWLRDIGIERRPADGTLDEIRISRRIWF